MPPAATDDNLPVEPQPRSRRRWHPWLEAGAALLLGALVAIVVRRPQDLSTTVPGDAGDPLLLSWLLAWPAHALTSGKSVWDTNAFAPVNNSLAFSDPLLGYVPFGLVGAGPEAAVVRYNVVLLFTYALAFAGTWVLVRQLGLGRTAALVAAMAFAFSPWRAAQVTHLQVLSSGGIPLALAMLARGHGIGARLSGARSRPAWALAGWVTATWQMSIGPPLGLQLAYLLAICVAVATVRAVWRARRGSGLPPRALIAADVVGLALFVGASALLAQPYLDAAENHPQLQRSLSLVAFYSPSVEGLITAHDSSLLWGRYSEDRREGITAPHEEALFPGLVVTVLAAVGLAPGRWSLRRRAVIAGAVVVVAACALGTEGPADGRLGYLLLYEHVPGFQGIRTPGRLVTTALLGLALLAAHGVHVANRLMSSLIADPVSTSSAALTFGVGLAAAVLIEGLDTRQLAQVPPAPEVALAEVPQPVLVLPSEEHLDHRVMLWSTDRFPRIVNGTSGIIPSQQAALRDAAARLPAPDAVAQLRRAGVATLVLLPDQLAGTRYAHLDAAALRQLDAATVEVGADVIVVRLEQRG